MHIFQQLIFLKENQHAFLALNLLKPLFFLLLFLSLFLFIPVHILSFINLLSCLLQSRLLWEPWFPPNESHRLQSGLLRSRLCLRWLQCILWWLRLWPLHIWVWLSRIWRVQPRYCGENWLLFLNNVELWFRVTLMVKRLWPGVEVVVWGWMYEFSYILRCR